MANMFSGMDMVQIPKNIKECTKTNDMTRNLWTWARRLETWGKVLCVIIIVAGLVLSIIEANQVKEVTTSVYSYYSTKEVREFSFQVFFSEFIQDLFIGIITYLLFHSTALLIGGLASIVQHTKISANLAMMQASGKNLSGNMPSKKTENHTEDIPEDFTDNEEDGEMDFDPDDTEVIKEWKKGYESTQGVCEFCGEETFVRQMIVKSNESGKKGVAWLCDDCIKDNKH